MLDDLKVEVFREKKLVITSWPRKNKVQIFIFGFSLKKCSLRIRRKRFTLEKSMNYFPNLVNLGKIENFKSFILILDRIQ
jgi:hypothetical protein